jgi:hypothetical protein
MLHADPAGIPHLHNLALTPLKCGSTKYPTPAFPP